MKLIELHDRILYCKPIIDGLFAGLIDSVEYKSSISVNKKHKIIQISWVRNRTFPTGIYGQIDKAYKTFKVDGLTVELEVISRPVIENNDFQLLFDQVKSVIIPNQVENKEYVVDDVE